MSGWGELSDIYLLVHLFAPHKINIQTAYMKFIFIWVKGIDCDYF